MLQATTPAVQPGRRLKPPRVDEEMRAIAAVLIDLTDQEPFGFALSPEVLPTLARMRRDAPWYYRGLLRGLRTTWPEMLSGQANLRHGLPPEDTKAGARLIRLVYWNDWVEDLDRRVRWAAARLPTTAPCQCRKNR